MAKKQKPTLGFFYIHLCDIDQHDFENRESLLHTHIIGEFNEIPLRKHTQYLSSEKPLDNATETIIYNLRFAAINMDLTPVVFVDETLANAYEFIGRLKYGAVVIYNGNSIDMESLINFSSKYLDLAHNYKANKSMKGHESIQIVDPAMFEFNVNKSLTETLEFYRFAPCKLLPVSVQMYMRGNLTKLLDVLDSPDYNRYKDLKTKRAFKLDDNTIGAISHYDTTLNTNEALAFLKRNKSLNKKSSIKNQFTIL